MDSNANPKDTKDLQDFEMGEPEQSEGATSSSGPKINKYTDDIKMEAPASMAPAHSQGPHSSPQQKVDPMEASASIKPAPTEVSATETSASIKPMPKPAQSASPTPTKPAPIPPDPAKRKKVILGCLGAFGGLMLIFLLLSFIFLGQSGSEPNPIAKLLGVNQAVFVNGLITFIHIIFILVSLVAFIFTMVGLFKATMARKDDKDSRKAGLRMSLISGVFLFFTLLVWGFTYIYLDAKRIEIAPALLEPIITEPEDTLNLSAPIEVKFDAKNVPIDRNKYQIVAHEWDFGDKSTGTSQIVSHVYKDKGIYDVKLIVRVKDEETGEIAVGGEYHVTVSITNQALAAIFSADPQSGEAPLEVKFDASESSDPDGNIAQYEWDFDEDGQFDDAKGIKPTYKFEKIGNYTVALRVTSTTGEYNVAEKDIVVEKESSPEAVIKVIDEPEEYTIGISYVFSADESKSPNGKITKYEWNFNDGSKAENTKTVSHVFKNEGTYEIELKVTDEEDEEGESKKILKVSGIKGTPKAKIKTEPAIPDKATSLNGKIPFTVVFDAKGSTDSDNNIVDYSWDFDGDEKADAFGSVTTHTFSEEGIYKVNLKVTDTDKNVGQSEVIVKAEAQGIIAKLTADKIDGNVPLTINFDASGSSYSKGQITSYKWDFGDGTPVKLGAATISHKYTAIGTYNVSVTVIGSDNTSAVSKLSVTAREIPLAACFNAIFEKGQAPLETGFDPGCSTGTVNSYFWDFGDGATSSELKPTHIFKDPGVYNVILEVSDAQNTVSKAEVKITVTE